MIIYATNRCGVNVPAIRMVDAAEGVIGIEWIDGQNVRTLLGGTDEGEIEADDDNDETAEEANVDDAGLLVEYGITKGEIEILWLFYYLSHLSFF